MADGEGEGEEGTHLLHEEEGAITQPYYHSPPYPTPPLEKTDGGEVR